MGLDGGARTADLLPVRPFAVALTFLLASHMLMGRGFAYLGFPPIYLRAALLGRQGLRLQPWGRRWVPAHRGRSLRAPHNSHFTVLARMGVPGFVHWLLLQGAFGIQLLRSVIAHRRSGEAVVAAIGGWILVYWTAMMVDTSFDPYLGGPQDGIWFWTLFGLGLVVIRLAPRLRWR